MLFVLLTSLINIIIGTTNRRRSISRGFKELKKQAAESGLERIRQPSTETALETLAAWERMAEAAYSKNTRRAMKADGAVFYAFCERVGESFFPAASGTIRTFIEESVLLGKKPAAIRRYVATTAKVHVAAGLSSPTASESVQASAQGNGTKDFGTAKAGARAGLEGNQ